MKLQECQNEQEIEEVIEDFFNKDTSEDMFEPLLKNEMINIASQMWLEGREIEGEGIEDVKNVFEEKLEENLDDENYRASLIAALETKIKENNYVMV